MISSVVVKKDINYISFIKIEIELSSGKMNTKIANYELTNELKEHALNKHRVYLPCKINTDQDISYVPYSATLYVPYFWETEMIENYAQALIDEIYLYTNGVEGSKTIKQIEQSFMLEVVLL